MQISSYATQPSSNLNHLWESIRFTHEKITQLAKDVSTFKEYENRSSSFIRNVSTYKLDLGLLNQMLQNPVVPPSTDATHSINFEDSSAISLPQNNPESFFDLCKKNKITLVAFTVSIVISSIFPLMIIPSFLTFLVIFVRYVSHYMEESRKSDLAKQASSHIQGAINNLNSLAITCKSISQRYEPFLRFMETHTIRTSSNTEGSTTSKTCQPVTALTTITQMPCLEATQELNRCLGRLISDLQATSYATSLRLGLLNNRLTGVNPGYEFEIIDPADVLGREAIIDDYKVIVTEMQQQFDALTDMCRRL